MKRNQRQIRRRVLVAVILFAAALCVNAAFATGPAGAIEFQQGIEAARKAAKSQRPMVLFFEAGWCHWCRKMAVDTLADPKVEALKDKFVWVKIDIDKDKELAVRFGVEGVPVTAVVDAKGRLLGARSGYIPAAEFVEFVTGSVANPHPAELLPDLLERFQKAKGAPQEREAIERLVERLAAPDRLRRDDILDAFRHKGAPVWPALLQLMEDKRLATRAAAAGALKQLSKADLPFHPFAESEVRKDQLAAWQKWVEAHAKGT